MAESSNFSSLKFSNQTEEEAQKDSEETVKGTELEEEGGSGSPEIAFRDESSSSSVSFGGSSSSWQRLDTADFFEPQEHLLVEDHQEGEESTSAFQNGTIFDLKKAAHATKSRLMKRELEQIKELQEKQNEELELKLKKHRFFEKQKQEKHKLIEARDSQKKKQIQKKVEAKKAKQRAAFVLKEASEIHDLAVRERARKEELRINALRLFRAAAVIQRWYRKILDRKKPRVLKLPRVPNHRVVINSQAPIDKKGKPTIRDAPPLRMNRNSSSNPCLGKGSNSFSSPPSRPEPPKARSGSRFSSLASGSGLPRLNHSFAFDGNELVEVDINQSSLLIEGDEGKSELDRHKTILRAHSRKSLLDLSTTFSRKDAPDPREYISRIPLPTSNRRGNGVQKHCCLNPSCGDCGDRFVTRNNICVGLYPYFKEK